MFFQMSRNANKNENVRIMASNLWFKFYLTFKWSSDQAIKLNMSWWWLLVWSDFYFWFVTCDLWLVVCGNVIFICDLWFLFLTCDLWFVICDLWSAVMWFFAGPSLWQSLASLGKHSSLLVTPINQKPNPTSTSNHNKYWKENQSKWRGYII